MTSPSNFLVCSSNTLVSSSSSGSNSHVSNFTSGPHQSPYLLSPSVDAKLHISEAAHAVGTTVATPAAAAIIAAPTVNVAAAAAAAPPPPPPNDKRIFTPAFSDGFDNFNYFELNANSFAYEVTMNFTDNVGGELVTANDKMANDMTANDMKANNLTANDAMAQNAADYSTDLETIETAMIKREAEGLDV